MKQINLRNRIVNMKKQRRERRKIVRLYECYVFDEYVILDVYVSFISVML